jgi:hypothetical protein
LVVPDYSILGTRPHCQTTGANDPGTVGGDRRYVEV